jgi:hypothetical protein
LFTVIRLFLAEYSARMNWKDLRLSVLHPRERTLVEARGRLHTLKALLPEDSLADAKYVAELHNILDFMEKGSGLDLIRYRMASPVRRTYLRINIMALLGVCAYQSYFAPPPRTISVVRRRSQAAGRVN